eukprot:scaffold366211_cov38-Prasinocladus_malaysianus.AAC.2
MSSASTESPQGQLAADQDHEEEDISSRATDVESGQRSGAVQVEDGHQKPSVPPVLTGDQVAQQLAMGLTIFASACALILVLRAATSAIWYLKLKGLVYPNSSSEAGTAAYACLVAGFVIVELMVILFLAAGFNTMVLGAGLQMSVDITIAALLYPDFGYIVAVFVLLFALFWASGFILLRIWYCKSRWLSSSLTELMTAPVEELRQVPWVVRFWLKQVMPEAMVPIPSHEGMPSIRSFAHSFARS